MKTEPGIVLKLTWAEAQALRFALDAQQEARDEDRYECRETADRLDFAAAVAAELGRRLDYAAGEPNPPRRKSTLVEAEGTVIRAGPDSSTPYRVVVDVAGCGSVAFFLNDSPDDLAAGERIAVRYHPDDQFAKYLRRA